MIELLKDMGLGALIQMQIGGCVGLVIASTTALALNPISLLSGALIGAVCGSFIRQQIEHYHYRNYVIIREVIGYREHNNH